MSLWWLEPGWTEALCGECGSKIWPEGDPDHGVCYQCFMRQQQETEAYAEMKREYYLQLAREEFSNIEV